MTFHIACIGEPLAEIAQGSDQLNVAFGGDTLNTAIYCARATANADVKVHYVTALGEDALSAAALDLMEQENIGTAFVTRDPNRQIGIYSIQNDASGERHFHYWRETSAARFLFDTDTSAHFDAINTADLVYISGITLAIMSPTARDRLWNALADKQKTGLQVAFDSNYRPALWDSIETARNEVSRFWQLADIVLPTIDDEIALFGDAPKPEIVARILGDQQKRGALKCGADGPYAIPATSDHTEYKQAAKVVDTTGAGDSFNGAYLASIAQQLPETESLLNAHELASRVVGHKGAILPRTQVKKPVRMGSVIGLNPENIAKYCELHADVWPGVLARLKASNFTNYSIYLKEPECLMFGYFEYTGDDFEADNAAIAADPTTQDWWKVCGPMQIPLETRKDGEWWADMREVFHMD